MPWPSFVAVVASGRAVDVSAYPAMARVCLCLSVGGIGMAVDARESGIVRRNEMAIGTDGAMMRDPEEGVVERGPEPGCGVVATRARSRVIGRDVIGDGSAERRCALPGCDVAAVAVRVRRSEIVISVDMALGARGAGKVEAGRRPAGGAVIEFSVGPFRDGMTRRAGRRG